MQIASGKITLDFYNNDNVALKTRKLTELCDDIRKKFNISILEVDFLDDPEKCVIGFAAVVPTHWKTTSAQKFMETICKEIDQTSFARVTLEDTYLIPFES